MTRITPGEEHTLSELAADHLPLVASLVRRFPPGMHEPEELYQQGCIGLMKALSRFRTEMGVTFSTYAVPVILGEMRTLSRCRFPVHIPRPEREMRQRVRRMQAVLGNSLQREPTVSELADALRLPVAELILLSEEITCTSADAPDEQGSSLADTLSDPDDWIGRIELRDILSSLPESDQRLLSLRHIECLSQEETAKQLGLTQVQVSRRETVLRRQLRQMWYGQ